MRCVLISSKARLSRLETLADEDRPPVAGIEAGMTTRGLLGILAIVAGLCAVIRRATGRLDEDCPSVTVAAAKIKEREIVLSRRADRAVERTTIVRGK
jgi:hypothetical protein